MKHEYLTEECNKMLKYAEINELSDKLELKSEQEAIGKFMADCSREKTHAIAVSRKT